MTGARHMAFDADGSLSFRLPAGKINYVKITLNSLDLYDVEYRYCKITMKKCVNDLIHESKGLYFDMLRGDFERVTGLRTSLTEVYA